MDKTLNWFEKLDDILACPVCLEIPTSHILQCQRGHHICYFCCTKLSLCPLCKANFTELRPLTLENVIQHLNDMKVFLVSKVVEMEVDICKYRKIIEKEYEDVSTQTDFVVSSSCTQTDENSCTSLVQMHESIQTVNSAISYPCLIGSCILQLPYELLIRHLRECHKDIFYEVDKWSVIFSEKWVVDTTTLPRTYEFAFFICNMGLFFFNAMIHDNGRLVVNIQYVDKDPLKKLFEYELALKNGNYYLRRFAMVTSYKQSKEMLSLYSLHMHETEMSEMIRDNSFECILTIKPRKFYRRTRI